MIVINSDKDKSTPSDAKNVWFLASTWSIQLIIKSTKLSTAIIERLFLIDANGILNVTARDLRSGKATTVEVQPSYGLTDEKVENILLESFEYAEEDIRMRQLLESRNEAQTILIATIRALDNIRSVKISNEDIEKIKDVITELEKECKGDNPGTIREKIDLLNKITMPFADQIMDDVLKSALENKKLSEALKD